MFDRALPLPLSNFPFFNTPIKVLFPVPSSPSTPIVISVLLIFSSLIYNSAIYPCCPATYLVILVWHPKSFAIKFNKLTVWVNSSNVIPRSFPLSSTPIS